MAWVMIRYTVRHDQLALNLQLLHAAYAEFESTQPLGLRWATFQLHDQVSFVSIVEVQAGPEPLTRMPAFQRYRATLDGRCDEPATMTELHETASFGFD